MVNQVTIIDGVTQQIYEKNLRNYPITKVGNIVNLVDNTYICKN